MLFTSMIWQTVLDVSTVCYASCRSKPVSEGYSLDRTLMCEAIDDLTLALMGRSHWRHHRPALANPCSCSSSPPGCGGHAALHARLTKAHLKIHTCSCPVLVSWTRTKTRTKLKKNSIIFMPAALCWWAKNIIIIHNFLTPSGTPTEGKKNKKK